MKYQNHTPDTSQFLADAIQDANKRTTEPTPPRSCLIPEKYTGKTLGAVPTELRHLYNTIEEMMDAKVSAGTELAALFFTELRKKLGINDDDSILILSNWEVISKSVSVNPSKQKPATLQ